MTFPAIRRSRPAVLAMLSLVAVTLAACASPAQTADEPSSASSVPAPTAGPSTKAPSALPQSPAPAPADATPAAETPPPVSGADMGDHIHNLGYDGSRLLIGTHAGLWAQDAGAPPEQVSEDAFDVMGLTIGDGRWLASGHPGEGMDAPADLGLLQSTDEGRTWTEVSLGGEVDFHRLVTSGTTVVGINAHDGRLLRSDDGGRTWTDLGTPGLYDVAISPDDASLLVGTTPDGPVRSTDGGVTFAPLVDAPLLALLAWAGGTLYGAAVDGAVLASPDAGLTWTARGSLPDQPAALAADGNAVAALVGNRILESTDGGVEFAPRIIELAGH